MKSIINLKGFPSKTVERISAHKNRVSGCFLKQQMGMSFLLFSWIVMQLGGTFARGETQTLISDGFNDGTRFKGSDTLDTTWYALNQFTAGAAPTMVTDNTTPLAGNVLEFTGSSSSSCIVGAFPKVALVKAGDFIEFSANFRCFTVPTGANTGPTLGLYTSNGTPLTADSFGSAGGAGDDRGYKATKYDTVNSNDVKIFQEETSRTSFFNTYVGTVLQTFSSALYGNDTLVHTVKLHIQLATNGADLVITAFYDGYAAPAVTVTSASVLTKTFDEAVCMPFGGMTVTDGHVDNLLVKTNVSMSLMSLQYESTSDLTNWGVSVAGVTGPLSNTNSYLSASLSSQTTTSAGAGAQCLQLTLGAASPITGGIRIWSGGPYAVNPAISSRIRVRAKIRTRNISPGDVHITLLEQNSGGSAWLRGGIDYFNITDQPDNFLRMISTPNWHQYEKIGELLDSTVQFYVYVMVKNNTNTTGVIYLDDFTVEQIPKTGDYLMETYTDNQGNVTTAGSQTLYVYPYDSRGAQNITVNVKDEIGNTLLQTITPFSANGKFASVNLTQPGYVQVTTQGSTTLATPAVNFSNTISAAAVPQAAISATSPFGMFSVSTANPLANTAGANWNRFYILTQAIYPYPDRITFGWTGQMGNAETPYLTQGDYPFLPSNQKWVACLFPIPQSMAKVPTGRTWSINNFYAPTDWTQFQALIKFIVEGLPSTVNYLEVLNEPDWFWVGTMADLNMYFKTVQAAVQQAKSEGYATNLKILGPCFAHFYSPSYNDANKFTDFEQPLYNGGLFAGDTGLLTYIDEVSMHAYVAGTMPEADFYDRIVKYDEYVNAAFPTLVKPIHTTEFGWQIGNPGDWQPAVTEATRMVYTSRSLIISRAVGLSGVGLFCLKNGTDLYSLINPDDTPYPSYVSYAVTTKALANVATAGPYSDLGDGVGKHAIFQNSDGSSVTCLWGTSVGSTVHLPSSVAFTGTDCMGRTMTATSGSTLMLTTAPCFLNASSFFYSTISGTITVTSGAVISGLGNGIVDDYLGLTQFTYNSTSKTITAPTVIGNYLLAVKSGGSWLDYTIIVR